MLKSIFALLLALTAAPSANAALSIVGGYSFGGGDATNVVYNSGSWKVGGELTFGVTDVFEVGAFLDHNFLTSQKIVVVGSGLVGDAGLNFYGGVLRVGLPFLGIFADGKLGLTTNGFPGGDTSFGWGLGAGYKIELLPFLELRPHIGYRSLPIGNTTLGAASYHSVDVEALMTLHFF